MAISRRISTPQQRQQNTNHNLLLPFFCVALLASSADAFTSLHRPAFFTGTSSSSSLGIRAPPGSGYSSTEDEKSPFPDTYHPMMEYPGTMRPGTTPENMPYQDLPMADDDPDPVPWPHFQQIEWHHKWDPPHPHPIPMEEFIDMHGRWATPEMEAAMRAGVRRDIRERQEQEATERQDMIITDDDDDDDDDEMTMGAVVDEPIALGDGVFGQLGSAADEAITAEAVRPKAAGEEDDDEEEDEEEGAVDDDLDNFLLDLGLDAEVDEIGMDMDIDDDVSVAVPDATDDGDESDSIDVVSDGGDISATINVEEDDDNALGVDEDDEMTGGSSSDGVSTVPLDAFADSEDSLDGEDIFDDGGFDYDDGDFDGGDVW